MVRKSKFSRLYLSGSYIIGVGKALPFYTFQYFLNDERIPHLVFPQQTN